MNAKPPLPPPTPAQPASDAPSSGAGTTPKTLDYTFNPPTYPFVIGEQVNPGIMLRDTIAIEALKCIFADLKGSEEGKRYLESEMKRNGLTMNRMLAQMSYEMADAMLERRMKP